LRVSGFEDLGNEVLIFLDFKKSRFQEFRDL
jgi:hypothetical protein